MQPIEYLIADAVTIRRYAVDAWAIHREWTVGFVEQWDGEKWAYCHPKLFATADEAFAEWKRITGNKGA